MNQSITDKDQPIPTENIEKYNFHDAYVAEFSLNSLKFECKIRVVLANPSSLSIELVLTGITALRLQDLHTENIVFDIRCKVIDDGILLSIDGSVGVSGEIKAQNIEIRSPRDTSLLDVGGTQHRHYDPSTGRYTQPDPLGLVDGPSRYACVGSDPLQRVDPDGLRWIGPGGGGRIFGYLGNGWGFRMDYAPNPSPSLLHFHCGPFDQDGTWGGHRPWFAPWSAY